MENLENTSELLPGSITRWARFDYSALDRLNDGTFSVSDSYSLINYLVRLQSSVRSIGYVESADDSNVPVLMQELRIAVRGFLNNNPEFVKTALELIDQIIIDTDRMD